MISDANLQIYNQLGFIPGPTENETDYLKRVNYCLNLHQNLSTLFPLPPPSPASSQLISEASNFLTKFALTPSWTPIVFSNYRLLPWHGGCAWIFQESHDHPLGAFFQLRKNFELKNVFLAIYNRNELIAHESIHIARMAFNEPAFEEMLAYQTSNSPFRKWLGPIVQSNSHVLIFFLALILSIVANLFPLNPLLTTALTSLPFLLITIALARLSLRHSQLKRCLANLNAIAPNHALAIACRLTDAEISLFAKSPSATILQYANAQQCLRWRAIKLSFFVA